MHRRTWELLIGSMLLAICLLAGLALGAWLAPKPQIGLLRFEGTIDIDTADAFMTALEEARKEDRIAGVVIEIASPGGLATSSESIFYTLLQLREEKPVVAVIDGIAVSGGYYIASAANRIYSPASSYLGNVGTRGPKPDDPELTPEELSSGPYKFSGGSRFDRIQQLDRVKQSFVSSVVQQRSQAEISPLTLDAATLAEARIYLGSEAVALGLADAEGSRTDGVRAAAELAGVRAYDVIDLTPPAKQETLIVYADSSSAYAAEVKQMVQNAPPDAVFLLDSRIPMPGLYESSEVERHLLHLRDISPATLDTLPLVDDSPVPQGSVETDGDGS